VKISFFGEKENKKWNLGKCQESGRPKVNYDREFGFEFGENMGGIEAVFADYFRGESGLTNEGKFDFRKAGETDVDMDLGDIDGGRNRKDKQRWGVRTMKLFGREN
jgi:hypothetical protein